MPIYLLIVTNLLAQAGFKELNSYFNPFLSKAFSTLFKANYRFLKESVPKIIVETEFLKISSNLIKEVSTLNYGTTKKVMLRTPPIPIIPKVLKEISRYALKAAKQVVLGKKTHTL